jgi:hypothetical protein
MGFAADTLTVAYEESLHFFASTPVFPTPCAALTTPGAFSSEEREADVVTPDTCLRMWWATVPWNAVYQQSS